MIFARHFLCQCCKPVLLSYGYWCQDLEKQQVGLDYKTKFQYTNISSQSRCNNSTVRSFETLKPECTHIYRRYISLKCF